VRLEQSADEVVVHASVKAILKSSNCVPSGSLERMGQECRQKICWIKFDGYTWPERYSVVSTTHDFSHLGYADNAYVSDPEQWVAFFQMPDKGPPGLWRMTIPVGQVLRG
jgi:1,4-alpha-glucan branching enzyme